MRWPTLKGTEVFRGTVSVSEVAPPNSTRLPVSPMSRV